MHYEAEGERPGRTGQSGKVPKCAVQLSAVKFIHCMVVWLCGGGVVVSWF